MSTSELPYLAQGPLAEAFAEQSKDFAFLYDRGTFAAWVGTRWSIGDPENLLLKRAVNTYLGGCSRNTQSHPAKMITAACWLTRVSVKVSWTK